MHPWMCVLMFVTNTKVNLDTLYTFPRLLVLYFVLIFSPLSRFSFRSFPYFQSQPPSLPPSLFLPTKVVACFLSLQSKLLCSASSSRLSQHLPSERSSLYLRSSFSSFSCLFTLAFFNADSIHQDSKKPFHIYRPLNELRDRERRRERQRDRESEFLLTFLYRPYYRIAFNCFTEYETHR